jgi:hypothetical protein
MVKYRYFFIYILIIMDKIVYNLWKRNYNATVTIIFY